MVKNFHVFKAIFINWWSRGNQSWLWNKGSCVQIPDAPFLFLGGNVGFNVIWTQGLRIQSQLCLPLHLRDWSFAAKKNSNVICLMSGDAGASLERVRRVRPHPLKFDNGCAAPFLRTVLTTQTRANIPIFKILEPSFLCVYRFVHAKPKYQYVSTIMMLV